MEFSNSLSQIEADYRDMRSIATREFLISLSAQPLIFNKGSGSTYRLSFFGTN